MPALPQYLVDNIANAVLDFHMDKGTVYQQAIQEKPLIAIFDRNAKTFPGGKGDLTVRVQGQYGQGVAADNIRGYTGDDSVAFTNPANIRTVAYKWREMHHGYSLTHTELKHDGLSVVDTNGKTTSTHSERDATRLADILSNKIADFEELHARSMNLILWGDGSADPLNMHGLRHFIRANPLAGTVGGLDASLAANDWWRNRARTAAYATAVGAALGPLGGGAVSSSPTNGGVLANVLQQEFRQLRRFGAKPSVNLAGSDFINALEIEIRANGIYTQSGFTQRTDLAMGDVQFGPITFRYDPTLDDLGFAKRCYIWDPRHIFLTKMESEWRKQHSPSRPPDKFVMYRSITSTGQMACIARHGALVIDIA